MAQTVVITSSPGLLVGGFSFGLYLNGAAQSTAGLGVVEMAVDGLASNYRVTGLADPLPGEAWSLTWNDGIQRGVRRWPESSAVPANLVIPLRQSGLVLADLNSHLYLDGTEVALGSLALASLGSPFDYLLSGIPAPPAGSVYAWSYSFGAVYQVEVWPTAIAGVNTAYPEQCQLITDLLDLMPDTLLAQFVVPDAYGGFVPSGAAMSLPCYIEGRTQLVRDMSGREVTSSLQVIVGGAFGLTVDSHRYTLPIRFAPRVDLTAIAVPHWSDETGPCHQEIQLP